MTRTIFVTVALSAMAVSAAAQQAGMTPEAQVKNALSAAPASVAKDATVMTFDGTVLHKGTSDWICFPDDPKVPNNSPMCLDATWREVFDAWTNKRDPVVERVGLAYMLQNDMPVSNTDPFATEPTADNQWIPVGKPHIMMVVPDASALEGIPSDPDNGGPWVMWRGTPYAHVMIPTVPRKD